MQPHDIYGAKETTPNCFLPLHTNIVTNRRLWLLAALPRTPFTDCWDLVLPALRCWIDEQNVFISVVAADQAAVNATLSFTRPVFFFFFCTRHYNHSNNLDLFSVGSPHHFFLAVCALTLTFWVIRKSPKHKNEWMKINQSRRYRFILIMRQAYFMAAARFSSTCY